MAKKTKDKVKEKHKEGNDVKVTKKDVERMKKMIDTVVEKERGTIYVNDGTAGAGVVRNMNKYEMMLYLFDGFDISLEDLVKFAMIQNIK